MSYNIIQPHELEFIANNYNKMSDFDMGLYLNRSFLTIGNVRRKMGLILVTGAKHFTDQERSFIKLNFHNLSNRELADRLGRTEVSIINFLSRNSLYRAKQKRVIVCLKSIEKKVIRMRELIHICETTKSPFRKDLAMDELKKLSGL